MYLWSAFDDGDKAKKGCNWSTIRMSAGESRVRIEMDISR